MPSSPPRHAAARRSRSSRADGKPRARSSRTAARTRRHPPRWRIQRADCLEALPKLPADSVDAIVTDPPYGLEFMGQEWDRLGDVGRAPHAGFPEDPGFKGFRLASYSASANVKCQRCGRWRRAAPKQSCKCGLDAVWPNVRAVEGRRIQEWRAARPEARRSPARLRRDTGSPARSRTLASRSATACAGSTDKGSPSPSL
jgi:hypothetical protein